jgi:DNA polymerase-3 subunit gamma/tau
MGQVLYRKYRSKKLSEIVGQEPITRSLDQALASGRISHAYLFTGPRGIGKTSIARILAHEINNLPYDSDKPHIDIIEIDAASNRRIDEIRDLRDRVHISPSSAKYKVYIIDEVHMLTKEAFNALLKTLEEPPAHVIFILATTDAHKLPDTIISRTQRFSFKPVEKPLVVGHLKSIAKQENIKVSDEALDIIAEHGEGSFRDSISLLDQVSSSDNKVEADDVLKLLGIPAKSVIENLIEQLESSETSFKDLSDNLSELYGQGFSAPSISKSLMNELRNRLVAGKLQISSEKALKLLKQLLEVDVSSDPNSYLQITLLDQLDGHTTRSQAEITKTVTPLEATPRESASTEDLETEENLPSVPIIKKSKLSTLDEAIWPEVLNVLKQRYNTLYGIVRMAQPVFKDDNHIDLVFDFAFHQKRVNDSKNKQIIANIILDLTNQNCHIECHLNSSTKKPDIKEPVTKKPTTKDLDNISKIFGDAEIVD